MASGTPIPSSDIPVRSRPTVSVTAGLGREDIINALATYRATVSARNRRALELCVDAEETKSGPYAHEVDPDCLSDFLCSEPLGCSDLVPRPEYLQRPRDLLTHFDEIAPRLGLDGTESLGPDVDRNALRHRYFTTIDDALRGRGPDGFEGELRVPDDLRILIGLVDHVVGPGLPFYRMVDQISFLDTLGASEEKLRESLLKYDEAGKIEHVLDNRSWEVAAGWQTGQGNDGSAHVLFCRNIDEEKDWGWRYRVAYWEYGGDLYDDLVSFLAFYAHFYEQDLEDLKNDLEFEA